MDNQTILLSICIPTYNRAECLKKALESIVTQDAFEQYCEVIISDNVSSDHTAEIATEFAKRYPNILYHRNTTNNGELNFVTSMELAHGTYVKLHGDKVCFSPNKLNDLVEYLKGLDDELVFLLNEQSTLKQKGFIRCYSFDHFVRLVSFWSTWLSGIILKRSAFSALEDKQRMVGSFLIQTDILLRIAEKHACGHAVVINEKMLYELELKSKGGYNIFQVFVVNYLDLVYQYVRKGVLSTKAFQQEKISLLQGFVFPWYTWIVVSRQNRFYFDTSGAVSIFFKNFWNIPTLYSYPFYLFNAILLELKKKILKKVSSKNQEVIQKY